MRVLLVAVLASGCLASPGPSDEPDEGSGEPGEDGTGKDGEGGEDGDGGTDATGCVPGSAVDLVYIDEIAIGELVNVQAVTSGIALLVNPGTDSVVLGELSVTERVTLGGIAVRLSFDGASGFTLEPGTAHGALAPDAEDLVTDRITEDWVNTAAPTLSAQLSGIAEAGLLPIEVRVGDYVFEISIRVVLGAQDTPPRALHAARVSALCP